MKHRSSFNIHHSTLFLALLAAVLTLAACEPESDSTSRNTITYVVANPTTPVTPIEADITSNQNLDALLDRFCDYAEQGQAVTFYHNGHTSGTPSKEATKFSTTSREEMKAWMRRMEDAGKTVTVTYNRETGTWNGTAYAVAPPTQDEGPRLSRVTFDQTFDSTGMASWERHIVYTYTWDGDLLTSVDEEWFSVWRSLDGTSDTSVDHSTAILTYQNGLCTAIGDVRNTYLGGRLAVQEFPWDNGGVYTFVYNEEGKPVCPVHTFMASQYGSDVMEPVTVWGAVAEWENGDVAHFVNEDGQPVVNFEYDNSLRPRGIVIGVHVLLPYYTGVFWPQNLWSSHNISRVDWCGSDYGDFELQYTHDAAGRAATAVIPRWTDGSHVSWTFEYVD